jgi:hypothetical protein
MAVSPFDHLWPGCSSVMEKGGRGTTMHTIPKPNWWRKKSPGWVHAQASAAPAAQSKITVALNGRISKGVA